MTSKQKRLLINAIIIIVLITGTIVGVQFAKGYRPNMQKGTIQGTGLLSVTSYPKTARVLINDKLTTVTDDKLYLSPAGYAIKIVKDGFHPWSKNEILKAELVTNSDARLFPVILATSPITFYQVNNPVISPDGTKFVYFLSNSAFETENGLYVYSLTANLIPGSSQNLQITDSSKDFSKSTLVWSPDNSQILAVSADKGKIVSSMLLSTRSMNQVNNLPDATLRLPLLLKEWQTQIAKINTATLSIFPSYITDILTQKAVNVYFSPDKEKVVYTATASASLPENEIAKTLPNINTTTETRNLQKDGTYVFDLKEGTNYFLTSAAKPGAIQKVLITSVSATPAASLNIIQQIKAQSESYLTSNLTMGQPRIYSLL